jgi:hypothetical protein
MAKGAIFSAPVQNGAAAHSAFYTVGVGFLVGFNHTQLAPRLKKEYRYN